MDKTITDLISEYEDANFEWGKLDCVAFAASIAYKYKNKPVPDFQKDWKYSDIKSAIRFLNNLGIDSLDELHKAPELFLGLKRKDISEVQHGDAVYYINERGNGILGICNGCRAYFLCEAGGLTARDVNDCIYCWSID